MKLFTCQTCAQTLYFENTSSERCGSEVGYIAALDEVSVVTPQGRDWAVAADGSKLYRFCANWEKRACNWLVPADSAAMCEVCSHNGVVPDVTDPSQHALWVRLEQAKRRLYYTLLKLELPLPNPSSGDPQPLRFDFPAALGASKPMTGHDNGLITIALDEADDVQREKMRTSVHEPYRTLLGHLRHEVGHFYWDMLVRDGAAQDEFRAMFGDERQDYAQALAQHYRDGPPADWQQAYISAYSTAHPWEDFAETWAHYLHIVDTLETADAFGLSLVPQKPDMPRVFAGQSGSLKQIGDIDVVIRAWLPLVFAVNSLNRSMGQPDLYPFILPPPAIAKLDFVRVIIQRAGGSVSPVASN